MTNDLKKKIARTFSQHSNTYDSYAKLQKLSTGIIVEEMDKTIANLPQGPVLEIGCGSGLLSEKIIRRLPERDFDLLDFSAGMLAVCKERLQDCGIAGENVRYLEADAENITVKNRYAMIVSGLTIQWFGNLERSLKQIIDALVPGGVLVCSFLGDGSFGEWRQQCEKSGVLCTLNPLPDITFVTDKILNSFTHISLSEKIVPLSYPSVKDFFMSLKKTGTAVNLSGARNSLAEMKRLISEWQVSLPNEVQVTCRVLCLSLRK